MRRMRGILALALAAMVVLTAGSAIAAKTKKSTSSSNKTVLEQVSSATSSFFQGVVDTVTLKRFTSKSKTNSAKK